MAKKIKAILCWSGGKDSALCLYEVLNDGIYDVKYLLTTINENSHRVSMHGVREDLLDKQTAATGIPSLKMYVKEGSNEEYEQNMQHMLLTVKLEGIEHVIFGDIFLEDLRAYREHTLLEIGMKAIFPLWKKNTSYLIKRFFSLGFRTIICCADARYFGEEIVGKELNSDFVQFLPPEVDPCGEHGEFHIFCFSGQIFRTPIAFNVGEHIFKSLEVKTDSLRTNDSTGFWFCDLIPE